MANIKLQSIQFPQINNTYTIPSVDNTLTVTGAAADAKKTGDEISDLKADLNQYGATNIVPINNGTFYPGSLTIVRNGNTATISGTTTGSGYTHLDFFNSSNSFPTGIQAGTKLQVSQNCSNSNVHFRVYQKVGDTSTMLCDIAGTGTAQITMSADATGCIIRISCANGNTYSSVVTAMYVFGTLTKQQTQAQIDTLSSGLDSTNAQVNGFKGYLPTAGDEQYVNPDNVSTANVRVASSNGTIIADSNYDAIIVPASIVSGSTYFAKIFSQALTVSEIKLYTFNSTEIGSAEVNHSDSYSSSQMSSRLPSTASASYFILVLKITSGTITDAINGLVIAKAASVPTEYQPYYITVDEAIDNAMGKVTSPDCVEVGTSSDDYAYTSIESAVQANPTSIIKVNYGTYETEVSDLSTDKILVGLDRGLCVLTGTDKDYDTPPIEIAGGMVKHFTVSMVNDDEAEHKGYCIHSDNAACANNTLIVEDCKFDCIGQHTIGMGIYPGETVIYNNCEFVFKDEEVTPAHAPFFAHNSGASDGVAKVVFHNCIFRGSGYALKLAAYSSNCSIKFEFIDCTCESDTLTGDNMVWTDYVTGDTHDTSKMHEFSGKFTLLQTSHGNNVDVLNYSA